MKPNFAGPSIMKDEVGAAVIKTKLGKATGPNSISVEHSEAFEGCGIGKITTVLNKIYDPGQIPLDSQ